MHRKHLIMHRLLALAGIGALSLSSAACSGSTPTAAKQSGQRETSQSTSERTSLAPSEADTPTVKEPPSGIVLETGDNAAFYEALEKEHQEALTMLPPLPEGAQYPPLSELDLISAISDPSSQVVLEKGYFKTLTASYWQCAWLSEAVRAAELGDTEKRDVAIDFLRGFRQSPLTEHFPTFDAYLADVVDPITRNDFSTANTTLQHCPPSTLVPKG